MGRHTRNEALPVLLTLLAWASSPARACAQEVRARVVDDEQRSAVVAAEAVLLTADSGLVARATTDSDGFFTLSAPEEGEYLVTIVHPGYETLTRPVSVGPGRTTFPAFVLHLTAIPLDTLQAEVDPVEVSPRGVDAVVGRAAHLLAGERLATLQEIGASFRGVLGELGGIRVRDVRGSPCIESVRGPTGGRGCRMVAVVVDGVVTGMGPREVRGLRVQDWESIEFLSGAEAGFRYGPEASGGALVLWTRGFGPHRSDARGGGGRETV